MNCTQCLHWNLDRSPLRSAGFGLCKVDPDKRLAPGRTFSGLNPCRFGRFTQATAATVARRMAVECGEVPK